jgi:hypothetical protein
MKLHRKAEWLEGPSPHTIRQSSGNARQQGKQKWERDNRPIARETAINQLGCLLGEHLERFPPRFLLRQGGRHVSRTYDADADSARAQQTTQS